MFSTENHPTQMIHCNNRIERHGDTRRLAVDIKLAMQVGNGALDNIEKGLKESLFRKPGTGEQQQLPIPGNEALTALKFPSLEPLRLSHEFTGYEIEIGTDEEAEEPIFLADVTVKKLVIEPLEGGSVTLTFTASTSVEPNDLRDLAEALIVEDVFLTLRPPTAKMMPSGGEGDTLDQQDAEESKKELDRLAKIGKAA